MLLSGTKGHNAYHGCAKCQTEGEYLNRRMSFPRTDAPLRTDAGFRSTLEDPEHHQVDTKSKEIIITPLAEIKDLDLIKDFPVADSLHLIDAGILFSYKESHSSCFLFDFLKIR